MEVSKETSSFHSLASFFVVTTRAIGSQWSLGMAVSG
jgi:hypothetical protein